MDGGVGPGAGTPLPPYVRAYARVRESPARIASRNASSSSSVTMQRVD